LQPTQLDLFRPADPMSAALAVALARLSTLCGPGRVGVLRDAGTHRPDVVQIDPFTGQVPLITGVDSSPESHASRVEFSGSSAVVRLALRVFRPPMPIEVVASRNRPYRVRSVDRLGGRVMHWAGPWRMRGEWWSTDPYAREYYDVELSDGGVYRIYRDVYSGRWLADGVYD
jgi:protein ImuB